MSDRDRQISEIFLAASELPEEQQADYLDAACGDDRELRSEVESLLAHDDPRSLIAGSSDHGRDRTSGRDDQPPDDPPRTVDAIIEQPLPKQIDRYRVEKILGQGGFGVVYLARDDQLDRLVAVKVPHAKFVKRPEVARRYLAEARTVAHLDHPHIVPVYDVGSSEDFPCYIVSKYIEGANLASQIRQERTSYNEAAELVATVAEALFHAHQLGTVHRDMKPGNILIDRTGKPFVVDFGMALRDVDLDEVPRFAGTPAYMSPEQARGEGHRVDGRSDIFSLGVVFYELLVGRQPFSGDTPMQVFQQITLQEPRPPRRYDDSIPRELERICQRAMSKQASQRYSTAGDMADDLRHFLSEQSESSGLTPSATRPRASRDTGTDRDAPTPGGSGPRITVIPKGLRSFDAEDADFFLGLLPGPCDREGLPDSLRFWKRRIEESDPDGTFRVGLIYGPSGCGKSSLVKAGLLPRLSKDVISVYVESTATETEPRLLSRLRRRCPTLDENLSLKDTLASLRRGIGIASGKKVLVVLDQFEQWLFSNKEEVETELVEALRQCDGARVQCIVMVRDDFWLAVTRFMDALEIDLLQGQNTALVDLFELRHARRVLAAFGRAFGAIPDVPDDITKEHKHFLEQAVNGLEEDGKIVCVRLALFAEMVKGKPWTPATLKQVGGTLGVGVAFLEETFSAPGAHPKHRLHQQAARAVLKSLLPDAGTSIRVHQRSSDELQHASGYTRQRDFEELIRILDSELRLITPTDPEVSDAGAVRPDKPVSAGGGIDSGQHRRGSGEDAHQGVPTPTERSSRIADGIGDTTDAQPAGRIAADGGVGQPTGPDGSSQPNAQPSAESTGTTSEHLNAPDHPPPVTCYYHLTHDYLVPSIRAWLTGKQRETRRGRAELLLAERVDLWNAKPESRHLPSVWEDIGIRALTRRRNWTPPQRAMMRKAGRLHGSRLAIATVLLAVLAVVGFEVRGHVRGQNLVDSFLACEIGEVPQRMPELMNFDRWTRPLLQKHANQEGEEPSEQKARLHAQLALIEFQPQYTEHLLQVLLEAPPVRVEVIRDRAHPDAQQVASFWKTVHRGESSRRRLNAACLLAQYAANDNKAWQTHRTTIASLLIDELSRSPRDYDVLTRLLKPVRVPLAMPLGRIMRDTSRTQLQQETALLVLLEYGDDQVEVLCDVLLDVEPEPFARLLEVISPLATKAIPILETEIGRPLSELQEEDTKEHLAQRQASAAVALLRFGQPRAVWPLLQHGPDPRARTYLIHRLFRYGAEPNLLIDQFNDETREVSIRRALLLSLGEFTLPETSRQQLLPQLKQVYETHRDAGLHAAVEWLLRQWGRDELVGELRDSLVESETQLKQRKLDDKRQWYVTSQGHTMAVIEGGSFQMGSLPSDPDAGSGETSHNKRITRRFALSTTAVTRAQYLRFQRDWTDVAYDTTRFPQVQSVVLTDDSPITGVTWYEAAAYCNWLSEQEGISEDQRCYDPNQDGLYAEGMRPKAGYLAMSGYRLPNEAEWEYACRAEAITRRYYGHGDEQLSFFAWFSENSQKHTWPVGRLKPNDFGLFDMYGNVWTWCHNRFLSYGQAGEDLADVESVQDSGRRVLRGGSLVDSAANVRSAIRFNDQPVFRTNTYGFRLARTYSLSP